MKSSHFEYLARAMGAAARKTKDAIIDKVCDEYGSSDEVRRDLKKVNEITVR